MRRMVLLGMLAVLGVAAWTGASAATLTPGGIEVWGTLTEAGLFELTFQLEPTVAPQPRVLSVQFFAMPSHTPLAVVVNQRVPAQVLAKGQVLAPRALARIVQTGAPVSLYLAPPPDSDTTVLVEYTVEAADGGTEDLVMAEGVVGHFVAFHFTVEVEPTPMMPIDRECLYCGERLCGCTGCKNWQVCCPACVIDCSGVGC